MLIEGVGWFCDRHGVLHCPICPAPFEIQQAQQTSLAELGRELWSEVHTTVTIETLPQWEERIPSYSCKCKAFYNAWKIDNPPRPDDFFAWTVELHNAVNAKLENPIITLQQAREIWMK